jgi:hypothetical protein
VGGDTDGADVGQEESWSGEKLRGGRIKKSAALGESLLSQRGVCYDRRLGLEVDSGGELSQTRVIRLCQSDETVV